MNQDKTIDDLILLVQNNLKRVWTLIHELIEEFVNTGNMYNLFTIIATRISEQYNQLYNNIVYINMIY